MLQESHRESAHQLQMQPEVNVTLPEFKLPDITVSPEIKLPARSSIKKGKAWRTPEGNMEFSVEETNVL
jgi:hypothetical protein